VRCLVNRAPVVFSHFDGAFFSKGKREDSQYQKCKKGKANGFHKTSHDLIRYSILLLIFDASVQFICYHAILNAAISLWRCALKLCTLHLKLSACC